MINMDFFVACALAFVVGMVIAFSILALGDMITLGGPLP